MATVKPSSPSFFSRQGAAEGFKFPDSSFPGTFPPAGEGSHELGNWSKLKKSSKRGKDASVSITLTTQGKKI
ncbi:hypothetical protein GX48_04222 [Paracoccidioides brasiliensis]|nr:hypothetical protein GX48_04222 [Paracoccidioides brasiliensis]